MVEFDFIRRILKARFQKFFKENKPLFRTLSEQSSLDRDSHLEEATAFKIRVNSCLFSDQGTECGAAIVFENNYPFNPCH